VHYHPLFQFQLMGLYGAFLTADLFNLFVFFEIMLAASYGLLLHGSGWARVRRACTTSPSTWMASSLFLIGVAMLYGVTGTLNMADMRHHGARWPVADRGLLHAGAAILAVAFLVKAAVWPLNFWLCRPTAPPRRRWAALFAIMTKVGVYAILRCGRCCSRRTPAPRRCSAARCWWGWAWSRWPSAPSASSLAAPGAHGGVLRHRCRRARCWRRWASVSRR
jgi:formate hydrogenlyase subunit 3/multisubunit Na+/H+ antiporter MnhD subunit